MRKIELDIIALSHSIAQSHNYAVVLGERGGKRRLPIVIGGFEAQAIAVAMERMAPSRPLTHDLMRNVLHTFDIEIREIIINNLLEGIFYAKLVCVKDGETIEIDSRTSDALALAVRIDCPIYTYEFILETAGIVLEEQEPVGGTKPKDASKTGKDAPNALSRISEADLEAMLQEVLEKEDYEKAAQIRDELNKRRSS